MTFTINSKQLLAALNLTAKGISANNITPSASCYRFHSNNGLEISTCNLEISMQTKIAIELDALDILIPADKITQLLASLPDQALTITVQSLDVTIKWASGECQLAGYSADDYPVIKIDTDSEMVLPAEDLAEAIYATGYARSMNELLVKFVGINLEMNKDSATFVASNMELMSVFKLTGKFKEQKMLLPPALISALPALTGDVKVPYSKNSICFEFENLTIKSLLIDEQFPDWRNFLPKNDVVITAHRNGLIAALKRVLQFSNKISNQVQLVSNGSMITISGENSAYNQRAKENVNIDGGEININVNGLHLADALSHMGSEQIEIRWSASNVPILVNEPGESDNFVMVMAMFGV